jgi:hypoxanthine phosphoribosyltransferase
MKKIYLTWQDVENQTQEIIRQMHQSQWMPDYIVGITRGGLTPANLISQYLNNIPMATLKVALRDNPDCESNCWIPEDATQLKMIETNGFPQLEHRRTKILIVDDINDSGATLNWIKQDWQASTAGTTSQATWDQIWNNNVRIATLYDNESSDSELTVDYSAVTINKANEDVWIVFPWEDWWAR